MSVFDMQLERDQDGRIIEKTETVAGKSVTWKYAYDKGGRLAKTHLDDRLICQCDYDREGRRRRDYLPATVGPNYRNYQYTMDNRLLRAGNSTYTHDQSGFRSIWSSGPTYYLYEYSPDYRLLKMEVENGDRVFTYDHDEDGRRIAKYLNGNLVEAYQWRDFISLGAFHDGQTAWQFGYGEEGRLPEAVRNEGGTIFTLHYDQVGSLRVVADRSGNVIKKVLYDPFGGIIKDTNPGLRIPLGFAGGLHDRDLGFVRFGWRDYDTRTGRWTAPDPIGDRGGDPDWYGYCLDDPVNGTDPLGLFTDVLFYDSATGHIAVAPGSGPAVGKYPRNGKEDAFNGVGEYRDETRTPTDSVRLKTTPEQEAYMKEYQGFAKKSTSVNYDLGNDDCVDAADNTLEAGGLKTPQDTTWVKPDEYLERLKKMYE